MRARDILRAEDLFRSSSGVVHRWNLSSWNPMKAMCGTKISGAANGSIVYRKRITCQRCRKALGLK